MLNLWLHWLQFLSHQGPQSLLQKTQVVIVQGMLLPAKATLQQAGHLLRFITVERGRGTENALYLEKHKL